MLDTVIEHQPQRKVDPPSSLIKSFKALRHRQQRGQLEGDLLSQSEPMSDDFCEEQQDFEEVADERAALIE